MTTKFYAIAIHLLLLFEKLKEGLRCQIFSTFSLTPTSANTDCFWTEFRKWLFRTLFLFLDIHFQNHPDSVTLQKYQSLSDQSFKHNLAHMLSLNLNPMLSFEPRFRMFIISCYSTKNKRLWSLDSLLASTFFAPFKGFKQWY